VTTTMSIYLDYNASTPIDPAVTEAMRPFLDEAFGNPSSGHWASAPAKAALERAREEVAKLLSAAPDEIVFTSGGSEANNLAIKGTYFAATRGRAHIITSTIEHPAVLAPCRFIERVGGSITYLPVNRTGLIDPEDVRRAIRPQTLLISIMHANNEVGTVQPLAEIAAIAREHRIRFHTDAAQSVGKIPTVRELGVDMLTIAGHKLYAPKGVGALYVRRGLELEPVIHGSGNESGRRAGTESALLAVGLGTACAMAIDLAPMNRIQTLRDRFWQALQDRFGEGVVLNGHPTRRLPNTLNVSFVGRIGADILGQLHDVAASTGSACHSGQIELSPVLAAMQVPERIGMGAIRFSLGRCTTSTEIDAVVARLATIAAV
jgi:cysteine desulfurase